MISTGQLDKHKYQSSSLAAQATDKLKEGRFEEGIQLLTRAIQMDDSDYRFYCNRSWGYTKIHMYKEALDDASKSIMLNPFRWRPHVSRGKALAGLKRYTEAQEAFQMAQKIKPDGHDFQLEMARIHHLIRRNSTPQNQTSRSDNSSITHVMDDFWSSSITDH